MMASTRSTAASRHPAGATRAPFCQAHCRLSIAIAQAVRGTVVHPLRSSPLQQDRLRRQQPQLLHLGRPSTCCGATDPDKQAASWSVLPSRFNPAYVAIVGGYAALFALRNPYIFAALSIATIIPQNSTTTSLNSLVILFYESGLFMNFAEAVYCVRLVTWLSILCSLLSFAVFT